MNTKKLIKRYARKQNIPIKIKIGKLKDSWRITFKKITEEDDDFFIFWNYLVLKGFWIKKSDKTGFTIEYMDKSIFQTEAEVWFFDKENTHFKKIGTVMININDISNECERIFGSLQNANYTHPFRCRSMDVGDYIKLPNGICYIVDSVGWTESKILSKEEFDRKFHPQDVWIKSLVTSGLLKTNPSITFNLLEKRIETDIKDFTTASARNFMPISNDYWLYWVNQNKMWGD